MSRIFLNDDDVVSMAPANNFTQTSTSRIEEVKSSLREWLKNLSSWLGDGVKCRVLLAEKAGWHKGKVRLLIEFVPDNPDDFVDKTTINNPLSKDPSPLDDLRTDLNI